MRITAAGVLRIATAFFLANAFAAPALAQSPRLKNIELCNGQDRSSPGFQIQGCTARIESVGETARALADCNESLRLEPNVPATLDTRGFTHLRMGDWDGAIADYNAALRLDPKLASSLYGRGFVRLKTGDRGGNADIAAAKAIKADIA